MGSSTGGDDVIETNDAEPLTVSDVPTVDAYGTVRAAILNGDLPPGQVYSQAKLSELLGIGRTPLREAVRRLQSEGLLDINPRRRLRIAPLSPVDLGELYSIRIMLETLAVRLTVPQLTDEDLASARDALDRHVDACSARELAAARGPHREFHQILYSRCGDRLLAQVTSLWDQAQRYRQMYVRGASDEIALLQLAESDHEAILAAAVARDEVECADLVVRHLTRTALTTFARLDDDESADQVRVAQQLVLSGRT